MVSTDLNRFPFEHFPSAGGAETADFLAALSDRASAAGLEADAARLDVLARFGVPLKSEHCLWLFGLLARLDLAPLAAKALAKVGNGPGAVLAAMKQMVEILAAQADVKTLPALLDDLCLPALDVFPAPPADGIDARQAAEGIDLLASLASTAARAGWRNGGKIARAMLPWVQAVNRVVPLPLPSLGDLYSRAWHAVWNGADRLERLMALDPYVDMLAASARDALGGQLGRRRIERRSGRLTVAYLTHFTEWQGGTASGTHSLVRAHAEARPDHRVLCFMQKPSLNTSDAIVDYYRSTNVEVVPLYHADAIAAFREYGVDCLLVDNFFWVSIAFMAARAAPVQVVLDMTHIYGNLPEVDWWFVGSGDYRGRLGMPCPNFSPLAFDRSASTIRPPDPEAASCTRSSLGIEGRTVLGFIGRIIKASPEYLALVSEALRRNRDAVFLACGIGDATLVREMMADGEIGDRVHLVNERVDVTVYGPVLDVALDSHPFTGGETCRELMAYGVPVVSLANPDFDTLIIAGRDPLLTATDEAHYLDLVGRLATDSAFRGERAEAARKLARDRCDMSNNVNSITDKLETLAAAAEAER